MRKHRTLESRRMLRWLVAMLAVAQVGMAQTPGAASKMEFDVASVKQNVSNGRPTANMPIGPGAMYSPTHGVFSATGQPLFIYIIFAYKMTDHEVQSLLKQLPNWARDERYDIEAKSDNHAATKDDMRAMMQSLLADRLKLKVHQSTEEVSVYGLELATPGKLGPKLRPHPADDTSCSNTLPAAPADGSKPAPQPQTIEGGFPVICGGLAGIPPSVPGRLALGYRNVPLKLIALQMTGFGGLDRPVLDETGLTGNYDFALEFVPQLPPDVTLPPDRETEPSFQHALASQTGLKLVSEKGPVDVIIVDHIEKPSEN